MSRGERITTAREARRLSTYQLAKLANIREVFLIQIENDEAKAHTFTYQKLADILGVRIEYIFGEEEMNFGEKLEDSLSGAPLFCVKATMALVVALGTIVLVGILTSVASWVILQAIALYLP